ncbi:MAG: hypothetical protein CBD62_01340 [Candidatus Pelagibacter sp. TMED202]|nr:MAG: hypothetical protein CBD62_01340 [Candidatus Pelagibacter sp. TMED202]|tara:strand:- start:5064 stop:5543 length:480 start_codon:yes stop_codon:yes gene_type:complete
MKFLYIPFFLLIYKISFSLEMSCVFEEVYQNGEVQQGFFLVKDDKFRYEYYSKNLFTIIHNQNLFFLIENRNKSEYFKLTKNTQILEAILNVIKDYPNFEKDYYFEDIKIGIETSKKNIIKRIIILSNESNLSVYINDCDFSPIKNLFFAYSPFFEYRN